MAVTIRHPDALAGLALLALAAGVFAASADFPTVSAMPGPGPAFFPRLIAAAMGALGLVLLVENFRGDAVQSHRIGRETLVRVGGATLLLLAYVAVMPSLGFLVATALFLVAFMWFSGVRSPLAALVIAVGLPVALHYVFVSFLHVPLPEGEFVAIAEHLPSLPLVAATFGGGR